MACLQGTPYVLAGRLPKNIKATISKNSTTNWGPDFQTCEPIEDVTYSKQNTNCIPSSLCDVSVEVTDHFIEMTDKKDVIRFFGHSCFLEFRSILSFKEFLFSNRRHVF